MSTATRSTDRRRIGPAVSLVILGLNACAELPSGDLASPELRRLQVIVSDQADQVSLVAVRMVGTAAVGLQGVFEYQPAAASYLGQVVTGMPITLVNPDQPGRLRFAMLDRRGLVGDVVVLAFRRTPGAGGLALDLAVTHAGGPDGVAVPALLARYWTEPGAVSATGPARRMTIDDWNRELGGVAFDAGPRLSPGQGTIYGDVTLNGVVNLFDVIAIQNIAAGAQPLLTDVARDAAVAGDVAPANAPGLGEASDPIPPGLDAQGNREINVFDAIAIANFAAGVPELVAGQVVPGRAPTSNRATLTGVILTDRVLGADTVYQLDGMVIVTNGATLTIPAGTRIEGDPATRGALSIRRGSKIFVNGTRLEPVVMTCAAVTKTPGCWGGLQLNGAAPLNHGTVGGGVLECPELTAPAGYGIYGGCVPSSTSGGLRYLRVEHAGALAGTTPIAGLQLLGVGSGTLLEDLQVHASLGDGVVISGGAAQLRRVMVTDVGGVALDWNDGWAGKAQSVIIHRAGTSGIGIRGASAPAGVTVVGQPSSPTVYNVSLFGPAAPGVGGRALLLHLGTRGMIRNLLVAGFDGAGLEIDDAATCDNATIGQLTLADGLFFQNTPDFSADADCIDEVAFAALTATRFAVADPLLVAPQFTASPDLRPGFGSPAGTGAMPPADGFFDPDLTFLGAVPVANVTFSSIPWYAGWTRGW